MQKVVDFFQKYVQWIALGIGAVYLGLMAYSYLVEPAIVVNDGKATVLPADVDPNIGKPVQTLKTAMADKTEAPYKDFDWRNGFVPLVQGPPVGVGPGV